MIDLQKRTENATESLVNLLKREQAKGNDLGELTAQVILAIDFSGSMQSRYRNQEVQQLVERALALSLAGLDDDGDIQVFFFSQRAYSPITVNESNYRGMTDDFANSNQMGGTDYLPVIKQIREFANRNGMLTRGKPPVFVIFVTDGETRNERQIMSELVDAADQPIFWQFLGLGYTPEFLTTLDTMGGRLLDNVGLFAVRDSASMQDSEFYDQTIGEFFSQWLPAARKAGVVS